MATKLQVEQELSATAQSVTDENGNTSTLALSTDAVGVGTTSPQGKLDVTGGITVLSRYLELRDFDDNTAGGKVRAVARNENWMFWNGGVVVGQYKDPDIDPIGTSNLVVKGKVGIKTKYPEATLDVSAGDTFLSRYLQLRDFDDGTAGGKVRVVARNENWMFWNGGVVVGQYKDPEIDPIGTNNLVVRGKVGIGTTKPSEKLEVDGNILATGDVKLAGADCAEEFDVEQNAAVEPGAVMVMDGEDTLRPCDSAYDKRVAGVISGAGDYKPGIVLDRQPSSNKRMAIAISGKVYCKVDAQHGAIEVGDLLTTSPSPGYAMKADDPMRAFGAVIGKALKSLRSGTGLVPILVALQ